jgi:hypothetical protein
MDKHLKDILLNAQVHGTPYGGDDELYEGHGVVYYGNNPSPRLGKVYGGRKGSSDWISYVKEYAAKNGMSYKEALQHAGPSYHKMMGSGGNVTTASAKRAWKTRRSEYPCVGHSKMAYKKKKRAGSKTMKKKAGSKKMKRKPVKKSMKLVRKPSKKSVKKVVGSGKMKKKVVKKKVKGAGTKKGAKHNPWLKFLKQYRKQNPHLSVVQAAKKASKLYKGGAQILPISYELPPKQREYQLRALKYANSVVNNRNSRYLN